MATVVPLRPICAAIRTRSLLAFEYRGHARIVAPYCHGWSRRDDELLRAVQLGGESRSGSFGVGKLWSVSEIERARVLDERFAPDDPDYNPDDSALARIHCRVRLEDGEDGEDEPEEKLR